jgi:hypothetical protein
MVMAVYTNLRIHFLNASLQQNVSSSHSITVSPRLLIIIYPCFALHLLCWDPNFTHLNLNLSWNIYCAGVDGAKRSSDHDDYITAIPGSPQVAFGSKDVLQVEGICFCPISYMNSLLQMFSRRVNCCISLPFFIVSGHQTVT